MEAFPECSTLIENNIKIVLSLQPKDKKETSQRILRKLLLE